MRPYDAPGISSRFWSSPARAGSFDAFAEHFREQLARAYTVTLPLFLIGFFVVRRTADNPSLPFVLALVWLGVTFLAAVLLALKDQRRAVALERLRHGQPGPSTIAAGADWDPHPDPASWRTAPPTTSATCRPG